MRLLVGVIGSLLLCSPLVAQNRPMPKSDDDPNFDPSVKVEQKIGDAMPIDVPLVDENGQAITLKQAMNGKPTVFILAYYRCPQLCGLVFDGTLAMVRDQEMKSYTVGKDFNIVVVSFDPKENWELAGAKKRVYVTQYGRGEVADQGWRFLTGKEPHLTQLCEAAGFSYRYDKMLKEYNHRSGLIILTPEGKISQYFAGHQFNPRDVKFALMEASEGKMGTFIDQVFLSCYRYDSTRGKYYADVMFVTRIGGVLTLVTIAGAFLIAYLRSRSRKIQAAIAAGSTNQ
ncbi:MAG: SCO family protein [Zavarzinella sp.]